MAYRSFYQGDERKEQEIVYSQSLKAGKRTYFFDVRATRNNQYYLTITESKKRIGAEGSPMYDKHKIYLYGEDFENFKDMLQQVTQYIAENTPAPFYDHRHEGGDQSTEENIC